MSGTLEQERAKYALKVITDFKAKNDGKYRTLIKKLPAMILNNGLGQALAFLLADAEEKNDKPSCQIYERLQEWIVQQGIYTGNFINSLMEGNRTKYMQAQHETLKLLTWMKKFADAYLTDK